MTCRFRSYYNSVSISHSFTRNSNSSSCMTLKI
nr:MAG TPA: hypothetical protein [Crassvirales sp.]